MTSGCSVVASQQLLVVETDFFRNLKYLGVDCEDTGTLMDLPQMVTT